MNIHDVEKARERQQNHIELRRQQEAEARPDPLHRAIVFLLRQSSLNNRDTKPEADYFIGELDRELKTDPEKLAEIEAPPAPPAETAAPVPTAKAPVKVARQSSRFTRK